MAVGVGPLRRRPGLIGLILAVPCVIVLLMSSPDMSAENELVERLADLQARLQHLDSLHRARREEVQVLSHHLAQFLNGAADNVSLRSLDSAVGPEVRTLLRNLTGLHTSGEPSPSLLRLPSVFNFMPHLLENPSSLRPAYLLSKGRSGVSVVLGVPTVKREVQTYLMATLRNLVESMDMQESQDCLIVVFVGETDLEYVVQIANQVEAQFPEHVESGLIEVISPPPSYYPDFNQLRETLGDTIERVKWRSKQNLDFAFLMAYSQPKATFYVQLEDDILAKRNFITTMKSFALEKIAKKEPWFVLVFCQLGFIGKMFKCVELPWLIQFFFMFYNDKPVDWLLDDILSTKLCSFEADAKHCKKAKSQYWITYKPSLFQHIGTHSSLKGKVQKLKDKQFGKIALFFPHTNPDATVVSGIKSYKQHTLQRAYLGETFFWGLLPQPGDLLTITFTSPINVKRFLFRSGNAEHPSDKFFNTTVEALPLTPSAINVTNDGFVIVGQFDSSGLAQGDVSHVGKIRAIRLHVHSDSDNWAILSEIMIETSESR